MNKRSMKQKLFTVVCLLAFALPAALPHGHAASDHDAEICAGHLDHDGAEGVSHSGACPVCLTARTTEKAAPLDANSTPLPQPVLRIAHHGQPCHNPSRPDGDCDRTRAPPAQPRSA
ncbi:MAG: hypothetical protein QF570_16945 [Myxococcota bacterium]|jgi:hypothetical protein|nr:hypothetical protein [Myxococcota bacterium]